MPGERPVTGARDVPGSCSEFGDSEPGCRSGSGEYPVPGDCSAPETLLEYPGERPAPAVVRSENARRHDAYGGSLENADDEVGSSERVCPAHLEPRDHPWCRRTLGNLVWP